MTRGKLLKSAAVILMAFFILTGCTQMDGSTDKQQDGTEPISSEGTDGESGERRDEERFIETVWEMGLLKPDSEGKFHLDEHTMYAKFAFALWVLSGKPDLSEIELPPDLHGFSADEYGAFLWCVQSGLADETDPDPLLSHMPITRLEAMNILFRRQGGVVGTEGFLTEAYDDLIQDSTEIPEWGKAGLYWGIYHEFVSCTPEMKANPDEPLSNEESARILLKYAERFLEL